MSLQKIIEGLAVHVGNTNNCVADVDAHIAVDRPDFCQRNDMRSAHAHEFCGRKHIFCRFHGKVAHESFPAGNMKFHIVLHSFYIQDIVKFYTAEFAVDPYEDAGVRRFGILGGGLCGRGRAGVAGCAAKPFTGFFSGTQEFVIAHRCEKIVDGRYVVTVEGIFLEGSVEYYPCLLRTHV